MAFVGARVLKRTGAVLGSIIVFLVFGEVCARYFHIIDRINVLPRQLFAPAEHADLPYRVRPGYTLVQGDVEIRVNSLGLRGPEISPAPRPGWRRTLVLGDSVIFGLFTNDAETFPALLETELLHRGLERVEVLNAGAPGYNTMAELAFLRDVGLELHPDTVLVGISLNDFGAAPRLAPTGWLTDQSAGKPGDAGLRRSELYVLLRWLVVYARGGHWFQKAVAKHERRGRNAHQDLVDRDGWVARGQRRFYAAPSGPGWDQVRAGLQGFSALIRERHLDVMFLIFPGGFQVGPEPDLSPQRAWTELCAEFGLRCLDLLPAFREAAAHTNGSLFRDTQHPNVAGLAVAARATADALLRQRDSKPAAID